MKHLNRDRLIGLAILIVAILAVVGIHTTTTQAETLVGVPAASTFTTAELADSYDAASKLETAAQDVMNAVHALRKGQVAGVDLTGEQMDAIKEQGFGGLVRGQARYTDVLTILGVTQGQLNTWAESNPQPEPCYETLGCGVPE